MKQKNANRIVSALNMLYILVFGIFIHTNETTSFVTTNVETDFFTYAVGIASLVATGFNIIINIIFAIQNRKSKGVLITYLLTPIIVILAFVINSFIEIRVIYIILYILIVIGQFICVHKQNDNDDNRKKIVNIVLNILYFVAILAMLIIRGNYEYNKGNEIDERTQEKMYIESNIVSKFEKNTQKQLMKAGSNGKWGFINNNGTLEISCIYDYVTDFKNLEINGARYPIAIALKDKNYMIISQNNATIELGENPIEWADWIADPIEKINFLLKENIKNIEEKAEQHNLTLVESSRNVYTYTNEKCSMQFTYYDTEKFDIYDIVVKKDGMEQKYREMFPIIGSEMALYSDKYIPFYNEEEKEQGWYDLQGNKRSLKGDYKILEVRNNIMVVESLQENKIYFIDYIQNQNKMQASEVKICNNGYIVRQLNGKVVYIDNNLKVLSAEYDYIDTEAETELETNSIVDEIGWYEE